MIINLLGWLEKLYSFLLNTGLGLSKSRAEPVRSNVEPYNSLLRTMTNNIRRFDY